jgi:capsular exopolysaccharide synthesis family protein
METDGNMEEPTEEQIDLRDYLRVLSKRRWTIAAVFALVLLTVAVITFTSTPIYQSTARVVIEKENPNLVSVQEVMAVDATGSDYYQTQYKIIESRAVAREVIRRLDLANSGEFSPEADDDFVSQAEAWVKGAITGTIDWVLGVLGISQEGPVDAAAPDTKMVNAFIERVSVQPIRNSRLVDVSVEAKDPVMAAKMANEVVRAYIDRNLETKLQATKDAVQWLSARIDEERRKVEVAENALLAYKEKHGIITDFSSDAEKITAQKLAQLNQQVVDAESKRVEAETRYKQAMALQDNPDMLDSIPEVLSNELIREIKKMEVNLYNRMSELSKKYGKRHPQMVAIESELEDLRKRKMTEVQRVVNSLRNEYRLALAREESLKNALAQQKAESLELNKKAVEYGVLQRQAESARNMYELLVRRFKETSLTEEMKTGNIRVVDRAEVPLKPVKPRKQLNLLLALVVGLALGVGLAFFLEYLDNSIKLPDEIREHLKIPYLGPVPAFTANGNREGIPEDLVTLHSPKSTASESFRGIRTGIIFSSAEKAPQVILVTSAGPAEGKTSCATNLAVTMAQAGSRVILLDCDMRRPRVHQVFDLPRDTGISSVLVGTIEMEDAISRTPVENLEVMACGPIPPNPSEILGSRKMGKFIEVLKGRYDRIVIDTAPITAVTDAVVLSSLADGVVLVIRAAETPRQIVQNGLAQLQTVKAHILGAVLNGVKAGRQGNYYYQYYTYYYGEDGLSKKGTRRRKNGV